MNEFAEKGLKGWIRYAIQVKGRRPHLRNSISEPGAVLNILPKMEAKRAFYFPFGDAVQVGDQAFGRLALYVKITSKQGDSVIDTVPRLGPFFISTKASQRRNS